VRLKIPAWDRAGFRVLCKRLERGTFAWPTNTEATPGGLRSADLHLLLAGTDLSQTRRRWHERVA
jgi:transposase